MPSTTISINPHHYPPFRNKNIIRDLSRELICQSLQTDTCTLNSFELASQIESQINDRFKEDDNGYIQQILIVGLHLSQRTYTGSYSLLLNKLTRNKPSPELISSLSQWDLPEFFPELYLNLDLTPEESQSLQKRQKQELEALHRAFQMALLYENNLPQFFRQVDEDDILDIESADLYSQCYNQLCIEENFKLTNSLTQVPKSTCSSPPSVMMIVDSAPQGKIDWSFCLPTKDLLRSLISDERNPLTGKRYTRTTREKLKTQFARELKLLRYATFN